MMGYGEDWLTYIWLSDENLVRETLGLSEESIKLVYRPSFGRGRYGYGEFDALVITPNDLFLIESKWDHSSGVLKDGSIKLSNAQLERHGNFLDYCKVEQGGGDKLLKRNIRLIAGYVAGRQIKNICVLFLPNAPKNQFEYCVKNYDGEIQENWQAKVILYKPVFDRTGYIEHGEKLKYHG